MATREEMLGQIRTALGRTTESTVPPLPPAELDGVMPPLGVEDYLAKFEAEWEMVSGVPYRVKTLAELDTVLLAILAGAESHAIAVSRNPLLRELRLGERLAGIERFVTPWPEGPASTAPNALADYNQACFAAGAGITGVDFVLAESGSLVLSSATEGVQVASLAVPIHIALYRRSQLMGSLDEVLARIPISTSAKTPSPGRSVVFITGTSRTADIEQVLIRGVHGPRQVHAILVEDTCR